MARSYWSTPFITVLGLLALPILSSAHHSRAGFTDETTELVGTLVAVDWRNPHFRFTLRTEREGVEQLWAAEALSLYSLQREGVTRDLFTVGERVRVAGNRSSRGDLAFNATNILLEDGREVLVANNAEPRWSDDYIGGRDLLVAELDAEAMRAENRGLFRVWSAPRPNPIVRQISFTEAAIAARNDWDYFDNPAIRCESEGMPRIITSPHPYEFVENEDTITMRLELYDIERTILVNHSAAPEDEPNSALGYSIGSWEGDTLVVRTSRINWPYFDLIGTPMSEKVEVVERYSVSEDQSRLDYHFTITDPETFTHPVTIEGYRLALEDTIPLYDCQPD